MTIFVYGKLMKKYVSVVHKVNGLIIIKFLQSWSAVDALYLSEMVASEKIRFWYQTKI